MNTGKSSINEHFSEIVRVPCHGEETVSDEPLPGAEDEILLDISCVMQPDAEDVDTQDDNKLTGTGLIILYKRGNCQIFYQMLTFLFSHD